MSKSPTEQVGANQLETKIICNRPGEVARGAVIWLHGLGADYNDFVPVVDELKLTCALQFVFPNAPLLPVTINNGYRMRAWYDIVNFNDLQQQVDTAGIKRSVEQINVIIDELIAQGFNSQQIIIAGFSQGGVISYYTALNHAQQLGGLLVLSSYLPEPSLLDKIKIQSQSRQLPILICHGRHDHVVPINYARNAYQHLQQLGLQSEWYEYPMEHSLCLEEIKTISNWLSQRFKH